MPWSVWKMCKDCKYCNEDKNPIVKYGHNDLSDYRPDYERGWCSKDRDYVRLNASAPQSCYEDRSSSSGSGCFLTTACVEYKGLADDCEELTKLRAFRDNYLKTTEEGKAVVEEYYRVAPQIVEKVNASEKKAEIYDYIYKEIHTCIACIEKGDNDGAVNVYRGMVKTANEMVNA